MELKLAKEFKRICEKHNIRYFMIGGTFLGAVRHKGFIPWDDDMDVALFREDYDRFLEIAPAELGEEYFLQTWDSDPDCPYSYAKLRLNGTEVEEKFNISNGGHKGVFLDVFPYDNVPDGKAAQKIQAAEGFVLKKLLWIKKGCGVEYCKGNLKFRLKYIAGKLISLPLPYRMLKTRLNKVMTRYNRIKTDNVYTLCYSSYSNSTKKREWFESLSAYEYEDTVFPGPADYDAYLSQTYGDYMQLPPEEKRHTHDIISFTDNSEVK
ncbi:MAG: phosphorylcholine transferase LicD [Candidatus Ornithomonoglobus sp.]